MCKKTETLSDYWDRKMTFVMWRVVGLSLQAFHCPSRESFFNRTAILDEHSPRCSERVKHVSSKHLVVFTNARCFIPFTYIQSVSDTRWMKVWSNCCLLTQTFNRLFDNKFGPPVLPFNLPQAYWTRWKRYFTNGLLRKKSRLMLMNWHSIAQTQEWTSSLFSYRP